MNLIKDLHISKSFCVLGQNLPKCLGCKFCRLEDISSNSIDFNTLPSQINPMFRKIPVAVDLFYGDPSLQVKHTTSILRSLERDQHTGPVVIIMKGNFKNFPDEIYNLDLHFAFSTFGVDHPVDGGSRAIFLNNLELASKRPQNRYSIEFRPIVNGINDSKETIDWVFNTASQYGLSVGYSGLQGKPTIVPLWEKEKLPFQPYPGFKFGHKKSLSSEVEQRIKESSKKFNVNVFKKTACLISHTHQLERDYNAHYYRPNEVGCETCPMKDKCMKFKSNLANTTELPYPNQVVEKKNHVCILKRKGICEFPTDDCSRISGKVLQTDVKLTIADVRVTKWLTGFTVDADFIETSSLSGFWYKT